MVVCGSAGSEVPVDELADSIFTGNIPPSCRIKKVCPLYHLVLLLIVDILYFQCTLHLVVHEKSTTLELASSSAPYSIKGNLYFHQLYFTGFQSEETYTLFWCS